MFLNSNIKRFDNISSRNGLLPDSAKPLPELMFTYHQKVFCAIHQGAILQETLMNLIHNMCLEINF